MNVGDSIELHVEKLVAGGDGLARADDGRVVFVTGGLPGETVLATVRKVRKDVAFADAAEVVVASPDRVEAPCPNVAAGCGGCDWQHLAPGAQAAAKREIVVDALARIGGITEVDVDPTIELPATRYRQRVRFIVDHGRPAFRAARTNRPVPVDSCLVLHPRIEAAMLRSDWSASREVELAYGAATGETLRAAPTRHQPDRVGTYHEVVAGQRLRISARSFFQIRTDGAEALVGLVRDALGDDIDWLADLYSGVGLFAATIPARHVVAIEGNPSAVADCRHNLAGHDGASVHRLAVERWRAKHDFDAVVADPSRQGLGPEGVDAILRTKAPRLALVSCDTAAMARDLKALVAGGYRVARVTPVDLFPMTSHIEVVTALNR